MLSKAQLHQKLSALTEWNLISIGEQLSPCEFRVTLRVKLGSYLSTIYPSDNLHFIVRDNPKGLIAWRDVPNSAIIHIL